MAVFRRAGVRQAQERMEPDAPAGSQDRARAASSGPHGLDAAIVCVASITGRPDGCLTQGYEQGQAAPKAATASGGRIIAVPPGCRSFELKMHRAYKHLQDLKAERDGWIDTALKTVVEEPDPEGSGYYAAWVIPPVPDHASLSLTAGDCLQCLRSSLDHLALELATSFTSPLPDEVEKDSEFPIFGNRDGRGQERFSQLRSKGVLAGQPAPSSGLSRIRGIDPKAQAIIEGLQPYHRGNAYESLPLWQLTFLNNIDKHRTIHVVGASMQGALLSVPTRENPRDAWVNVKAIALPEWENETEPFRKSAQITIYDEIAAEGRTKVARWPMVPIDPRKKMYMNFKPNLDIAFDFATPLIGGKSVYDTLGDLHNYLLSDVFPPLLRFLK